MSLVLTLGALLAEVPHTRPVRLTGFATDPELGAVASASARRGTKGPPGSSACSPRRPRTTGFATASLWANVPHYISAIENPGRRSPWSSG